MRKIKQTARRAPEKRQTRKDASLLNKSRQVVTVKNTEPLSMMSQNQKKRKPHNQNEFTEDIFHNWRV
jgi:hypothetical protein